VTPGLIVAAVLLVAAAIYAHYRIPFHTVSARVQVLRAILVLVGIAFGYVAAVSSGAQGAAAVLVFLCGLGLVHVPAAAILFLKRARQEGQS
jgi:hypothetical protein